MNLQQKADQIAELHFYGDYWEYNVYYGYEPLSLNSGVECLTLGVHNALSSNAALLAFVDASVNLLSNQDVETIKSAAISFTLTIELYIVEIQNDKGEFRMTSYVLEPA